MQSACSSILLSSLLLLPMVVFSQNKVGNGGNVVQCQVEGGVKTTLLDFYEAGAEPKNPELNYQKIVEKVFLKLKSSAPQMANQYLKRLSQIETEIGFKDEIQLAEIPDSKHLFKPLSKNCEVLQAAVRNNLALKSEKRFIIRKDLWDHLEPTHQAGLITHEIIYEHLSKLGEENSIKARRINAFLYSEYTKNEFWKLIKELEIPIYP